MGQIRKRPEVQQTSELEMAEEAALMAVNQIRAALTSPVPDLKGAREAQKVVNRFIRLRNQQVGAARLALRASRAIKRVKGGA